MVTVMFTQLYVCGQRCLCCRPVHSHIICITHAVVCVCVFLVCTLVPDVYLTVCACVALCGFEVRAGLGYVCVQHAACMEMCTRRVED